MKNGILGLLVMLAAVALMQSCSNNDCLKGDGNLITRDLDLASFHSAQLEGSGDIYIEQGDSQSVVIEVTQNALPYLNTTIIDGVWEIGFTRCISNVDITVWITLPEIEGIGISGSGNIYNDEQLSGDNLDLSLSGSGSMYVNADYNTITTIISGSGATHLEGTSDMHIYRLSGSGQLKAFSMETDRSDITISGSGVSEVRVNQELNVDISGSGNVYYKGYPPTINTNISGSGAVIDAN